MTTKKAMRELNVTDKINRVKQSYQQRQIDCPWQNTKNGKKHVLRGVKNINFATVKKTKPFCTEMSEETFYGKNGG